MANAAPMDSRGYYRTPTIAGDTIVFVCEDDLWSVGAGGGLARRLTAGPGAVALPRLSPDGSTVAYVGRDEGAPEVYTIPAAGRAAAPADVPRQRRALRQRLVARRPRDLLHLRCGRAVRQGDARVRDRSRRRRTAPAAGRPRDDDRRRGERRDADRPQQPRPRALEALSRRHGRPAVGGRRRHRHVRAPRARTSTATSCGRCGTASASVSSPITRASATCTRCAPTAPTCAA